MRKFYVGSLALLLLLPLCAFDADGCGRDQTGTPTAASGVHKTTVHVPIGADGLTVEQRNIRDRLTADNTVGSIKHLYVISPYSGQVILYSTVKGKVTSSGKRITPTTVLAQDPANAPTRGMSVNIDGTNYLTSEVLQDDGSYGTSGEYLYWWDVRGAYHQQAMPCDCIIHISDQPLPIKSITINVEAVSEK